MGSALPRLEHPVIGSALLILLLGSSLPAQVSFFTPNTLPVGDIVYVFGSIRVSPISVDGSGNFWSEYAIAPRTSVSLSGVVSDSTGITFVGTYTISVTATVSSIESSSDSIPVAVTVTVPADLYMAPYSFGGSVYASPSSVVVSIAGDSNPTQIQVGIDQHPIAPVFQIPKPIATDTGLVHSSGSTAVGYPTGFLLSSSATVFTTDPSGPTSANWRAAKHFSGAQRLEKCFLFVGAPS
jgi:hypothetical protein